MSLPVEYLVPKYQDNLYQAAFAVLQNCADAQDAVQLVFIKYHRLEQEFENEDHIRKWLFRLVINQARDIRRSFWRRHRASITEAVENIAEELESGEDRALFEAVCSLPGMYRITLQLFYYEDFSVREIADLMSVSESAVKKRLSRGRQMLRDVLEKEESRHV